MTDQLRELVIALMIDNHKSLPVFRTRADPKGPWPRDFTFPMSDLAWTRELGFVRSRSLRKFKDLADAMAMLATVRAPQSSYDALQDKYASWMFGSHAPFRAYLRGERGPRGATFEGIDATGRGLVFRVQALSEVYADDLG